MLYVSQNGPSKFLKASNPLGSSQNEFSELLQAFYTVRIAVVKTDFSDLYKPPTCLVVVKTDSPNIQKPPTYFTVVKTRFPKFSLLHGQNGLPGLLQASYTLGGS